MTDKITARQLDAAKLLEGALRGDRQDKLKLQEGISTSDLPVQLAPTVNKIMLESYAAQPKVWNQFATAMTESTMAVKKAGSRIRFSWETIVNDGQIGLLERLPIELAQKAAGKEDEEVTKQLVAAGGLNTDNFKSGNQNLLSGNGALTIETLEAAIEAANLQTWQGGLMTPISRFALVVPRALEMTARRILAIQSVRTESTVGSTVTSLTSGNPIGSQVEIVVNDWITKINSGAGAYWFLVPVPGQGINPNLALGFLRGYETPELRIKMNGGTFIGGGDVPARDGSFDNDDFEMRIRHIATGGFIVPTGTIASTGAGS